MIQAPAVCSVPLFSINHPPIRPYLKSTLSATGEWDFVLEGGDRVREGKIEDGHKRGRERGREGERERERERERDGFQRMDRDGS